MLDVRHSHLGYFGGQLAAILSATLSLRNVLLVLLLFFNKYCFVFEHFQSKISVRAEERGDLHEKG